MDQCDCKEMASKIRELERRIQRVEQITAAPAWDPNSADPYDLSNVPASPKKHRR